MSLPRRRRLPAPGGSLAIVLALLVATTACPSAKTPATWQEARERMVREQIAARGVADSRVLAAMRAVPRHRFVPPRARELAYADRPLPIGSGQTISQPYIVAYMSEQLEISPEDRCLEVGTGSGYQAAVLSRLCADVFTIEIVEELAATARTRLQALGYENVHVRAGDGYRGWPEKTPFDAIMLTAAPSEIPEPLTEQLARGGRLIAPVGEASQELVRLQKTEEGLRRERLLPVRFVPMTGEAEKTH